MYLSGSKVIVILYIATAIFSAVEVLTEVQQRHVNNNNCNKTNNNSIYASYELNVLNDFLDINLLHRAIIIYTSSTAFIWNKTATTKAFQDNASVDEFIQSPLKQELTANYHIQFVNTLQSKTTEYLLRSLMPRVVVFMKYESNDRGKKAILTLLSTRKQFNNSLKFFLLLESLNDPLLEIQKVFGDLNILIDADITVAVRGKITVLNLYDLYKICHICGSPLEIVYKGNWTAKEGFHILKMFQYGIAIRRNDFKGFSVKASTAILNKSPSLNMTDLEYLNNDKQFLDKDAMQRKTYQLLRLMEELYNLRFDVHFTKNWGDVVNSTWTGALGLVYYGEAELTLCPIRYLLTRIKAFHYSRNIHTEKIHFLFRHPKRTSIRNIFFEPLADTVWWCVLALIIVTILMLAVHVHNEYKTFTKLQKQTTNDGTESVNGLQLPVENHFDFIVLCIIEAILMQGPAPELFRYNSTRLLVVSVSIFSILLMQFYGAFIVSSLLSEAPRTITNLRALYNSSLEIGMENVSYNYDVFINNKNPMVRNLYKYRICNKHTSRPNVMTLEEGAKKIGKGNFAFHVAIDRVYRLLTTFLTESQFCDLQEINFHPSFSFISGVCMSKSTPYYEFITLAIAMFQEAALLRYNDKKWEVNKIDCTSIQSEEVEVDLEHFAPALAFLFCSILLSALALIVEIIYKHLVTRMEHAQKINEK